MRQNAALRKKSHGFSLVEVLVASAVLVAVFLPVMFVFTQTVRQAEVSLDEIAATTLADEVLDQIATVPAVKHFQALIAYPIPNPPPAYSRWTTLTTTGVNFVPGVPGTTASADTGGWTKTGVPYAGTDTPIEYVPYLRMYLSTCPARFRREIKVHRTLDHTGSLDESEHLAEIEVRVTWDDNFVSGPRTRREVALRTIVSDPRMAGAAR